MKPAEYQKCNCRHCAGHIEFPAEAAGETVACPHCGQPTELNVVAPAQNRRWMLLAVGMILLVGGVLAAIFLKSSGPVVPPAKPAVPVSNAPVAVAPSDETVTNGFGISAFKLEKVAGSSLVYVTGTVRNLGGQQRFGVKIAFRLSDANQNAAGTATDYRPTLEPHGLWKFKALVLESKAMAANFESIQEEQ